MTTRTILLLGGLLVATLAGCAGGGAAADCGDGDVGDGEDCDDGNTTGGDGCSATCTNENLNCGDGSIAVLPVAADGQLGASTAQIPGKATCAGVDPAGKFVFVCEAANDRVLSFELDAASGKLQPRSAVTMKAGSAPRQIVFRPDAQFAYVLNERSSSVTTFAYTAANGALKEVAAVSTVPEYFDGLGVTPGLERRLDRTVNDVAADGTDDGQGPGIFRCNETVVWPALCSGGRVQRSGQHMRSPGFSPDSLSSIPAERNGVHSNTEPCASGLLLPTRDSRHLD
jgi:cysteine-rich repeat protein